MNRKKMLQGLVALGILAAVNAPAYAMEEEIVSYGGYDLFKVQYFDEADSDDLPGDKNIWNEYNKEYKVKEKNYSKANCRSYWSKSSLYK